LEDSGEAAVARRIDAAFANHGRRAALMPYLMGGYPDIERSLRLGEVYARAGADLVEVGVPFSDPLADGPAIQAAGEVALANGATLEAVIDGVARPLAERLPVVLMCYANPLLTRGLDGVPALLASAGISGLIVPDLPVEEAAELREACDRAGLALVPLVAPTTPAQSVEETGAVARGFVYVVSVTGVTGERRKLPVELRAAVDRVRAATTVPVAVGFGVGTAEQVAEVGSLADGVIVGSRLVRTVTEASEFDDALSEVELFLRRSAEALS
jgi:tryptophan synthase alpha chain